MLSKPTSTTNPAAGSENLDKPLLLWPWGRRLLPSLHRFVLFHSSSVVLIRYCSLSAGRLNLPANGADSGHAFRPGQFHRRLCSPPLPPSTRPEIPPAPPLLSRTSHALPENVQLVRSILKHPEVVRRRWDGSLSSQDSHTLRETRNQLCRRWSSLATINLGMLRFRGVLSEHHVLELSRGIREAQHSKDSGRAQALINSFDQV
jgi:hypothetical protein